ncbi:gliding motility-associated C-terminal domain-containing protein [Maribacter algicola]|uniref:Gliding motility-associated C-terminal domain-containing protein n=1 Tax=Meishania litoralis TaxID=3434685 RepID=A0ACC7LGR4_9FLAO
MKLKGEFIVTLGHGVGSFATRFVFMVFLLIGSMASAQQANLTVLDGDAGETGGIANPGAFQVTLTGVGLAIDRTINVTVEAASTAQANLDRDPIPATLFIPAGQSQGIIPVEGIVDDNLVEGDETVILTLLPGFGYSLDPIIANRTKTIIVKDNDTGQFTITTLDPDAGEEDPPGEGRFRIDLDFDNGTGTAVTVPYTLTGTATNGGVNSDYDVIGQQGTLTFPEGTLARTLRIQPIDDTTFESDETVILTLGTPSDPLFTVAASPAADRTVTIVDNDCPAGDTAPVLDNEPTSFCDVASVNLNTFFSGGLPPQSALRWSTVANPTTVGQLMSVAASNAVTAGTYHAVFWSTTGTCASPSTALTITINQTPDAGTPVANLTSCNDNNFGTTTFDLDNGLTGEDPGGTWTYISGPGNPGSINGSNVVNFNNDPSGTYVFRYTLTAGAPCVNQTADISISVSDCDPCIAGNTAPSLAPDAPETDFCDTIDVSLSQFTNSTAPPNTTLRWSSDSNLENTSAHLTVGQINSPLPGTYYAFFWDAANTCASPALVVNLASTPTPTITEANGDERCGSGTVTLTASSTGNPTFNWYDTIDGDTPIGSGPSFETTVNAPSASIGIVTYTFYVEATENSCVSTREPVEVIVAHQPSAGTPTDTSSCSNPQYGNTVLDLNGQLTGADIGVWTFTSGPATIDPGDGTAVDFIGAPDGIYVFTYTTSDAQAPCENDSASVTVSVSNCDTDDDGDGLFGGQEQALGTDPQDADSDNDGIQDGVEVGGDIENPLDGDNDGIIDALDSNVADEDNDGVVDQLDPANLNPCVPNTLNGVCDSDGDDIPDSEEDLNGNGTVDEGESDPLDPCDPNPDHANCQPIDLEVLKTVDNENAAIGDTVLFTITLNNLEDRKARSIIVGDLLESGFEYDSHTAPPGSNYNPDTGEWQIFEIAPLGSLSLEIRAVVIEGDVHTNTAELLSSLPEDGNLANNSASVEIIFVRPVGVNLIVEKTARLGPDKNRVKKVFGLINDIDDEVEVEYFIKVINKSLNDNVSNIRVQDTFSNENGVVYEFLEANAPVGSTFDMNTGVWLIDNLSVGEEIELSYKVMFRSVGTVVNKAQIMRSSPAESIAGDEDSISEVEVEITTRNVVDIGIIFNQFSPNDDGINDDLKINRLRKNAGGMDELVDITYDIDIFNRYGNSVYEARNMTDEKVWDGTWKGKEVPEGTYFYILNIAIENESAKIAKGWIQLIR